MLDSTHMTRKDINILMKKVAFRIEGNSEMRNLMPAGLKEIRSRYWDSKGKEKIRNVKISILN